MALVLGTNCGFVTEAPTGDPSGINNQIDSRRSAIKVTTTDAVTITEMGWYSGVTSQESNFEVGIYSHNSGTDKPGALLHVSDTNAKGTTVGWKTASVNFELEGSTIYWLAAVVVNTATTTRIDGGNAGTRFAYLSGDDLPATWSGGAAGDDWTYAIYAVYETAPTGTNTQINIGDSWKEISAMQINIGDVWKEVAGMQINIGDNWKEVY